VLRGAMFQPRPFVERSLLTARQPTRVTGASTTPGVQGSQHASRFACAGRSLSGPARSIEECSDAGGERLSRIGKVVASVGQHVAFRTEAWSNRVGDHLVEWVASS